MVKKEYCPIQLWVSMAQQFLAPSERKVMKAQDNSVLSFGTASVVLTLLSQLLEPGRQQLSGEETLTQQGSFPIKYYVSALKTSSIKFPALEVQSSPESLFSLRWWTLLLISMCTFPCEMWGWWRLFLSDIPHIALWIKITQWSLYLGPASTKSDLWSVAV